MKYIKMLGLAAVAAAALMAFVGASTASATTLTGTGCVGELEGHCAIGTEIKAENEGKVILDPPFGAIECSVSNVAGKTTTTGGASETVVGEIETLTFSSCNATVTVLKKGTLEIHSLGSSNGTLTSSGAEVTVQFLGTHCVFSTNNTDLGTVTGSTTTGGNATLDIKATIPRTGGTSGAFCGSTAAWTGAYKVTSPATLNVDGSSTAGGPTTLNVGSSGTIHIKNNTDSVLSVETEQTTNSLVLALAGTSCLGNLASTASCTNRQVKCVAVGVASYKVRISGSEKVLPVKCD